MECGEDSMESLGHSGDTPRADEGGSAHVLLAKEQADPQLAPTAPRQGQALAVEGLPFRVASIRSATVTSTPWRATQREQRLPMKPLNGSQNTKEKNAKRHEK